MQRPAFYLFLTWFSLESEEPNYTDHGTDDNVDLITKAMLHIDKPGRAEIVTFIDRQLSLNQGKQGLARLFDDGHLYFKWHTEDAPRRMLLEIRDAALSAPLPRSAPPQSSR